MFFFKIFGSNQNSNASPERPALDIPTPIFNEKDTASVPSEASSVHSRDPGPSIESPSPPMKAYLHIPGYDLAVLGKPRSERSARSHRASFRPECDASPCTRPDEPTHPLLHPETKPSQLVTAEFTFLCGRFF
ncbi:hypothetical protein N7468_004293 [Penicillium chermesinum]|uniref:Uncharacterized protein n=1 Tax=Penicillium chermesinum TaxID=63820 RepID=A0A9W9P817_9EURO|nr:uncharacterized protein N7468_004293 [Penicillium chermesinum]KAJ5239674.1 hypothetical protein N7468_004293 [Penicillium chermesinum]KAJ6166562.1 hypothetical protein N7470_002009 [Penicillium chermesinum]